MFDMYVILMMLMDVFMGCVVVVNLVVCGFYCNFLMLEGFYFDDLYMSCLYVY